MALSREMTRLEKFTPFRQVHNLELARIYPSIISVTLDLKLSIFKCATKEFEVFEVVVR